MSMQSKAQLEASASGALRRAIREAEAVSAHLNQIRIGPTYKGERAALLRSSVAELTKAVHELNAYRNALDTGS